jgi:hypothetical protein
MSPRQYLSALGCDYPDRRASSPKRRRLASNQAILRKVAAILELPKGSYSIRSCIGGPAVEADAILHGESIYINLSHGRNGYARFCRGKKDYSGGQNYSLRTMDPEDIAIVARMAMNREGK